MFKIFGSFRIMNMCDQIGDYKQKLKDQIKWAYGNIVYAYTCHRKMADRYQKRHKLWQFVQIILSVIVSGSITSTLFYDAYYCKLISSSFAILLAIINLYLKKYTLVEDAEKHQKSANELWKIREEYVSLLIDLSSLDTTEIVTKRNDLQNRVYEIYKSSLKTDYKSYKEARKALKKEEEQTFDEKEIDIMLPYSLRKN